ncbi:hypothetical protein LSTR_LSTR003530 [Laodelphax striatellus]|uniref:Uncharacterized protein n=1 Tax=Laodelphax striatellus TaxID=195883 RepID=A0A482WLC4_LAOST|nr:hypothetical protein LSTR_LSTR003530 [Laodelphax striatellus]
MLIGVVHRTTFTLQGETVAVISAAPASTVQQSTVPFSRLNLGDLRSTTANEVSAVPCRATASPLQRATPNEAGERTGYFLLANLDRTDVEFKLWPEESTVQAWRNAYGTPGMHSGCEIVNAVDFRNRGMDAECHGYCGEVPPSRKPSLSFFPPQSGDNVI